MLAELPDDDGGDSREERAFRMWINSLNIEADQTSGLEAAHVSNLFDDVRDGVMLLQTMEHVRKGVVDWSKVNKPPMRIVFKRVENLNYAVTLGRGMPTPAEAFGTAWRYCSSL